MREAQGAGGDDIVILLQGQYQSADDSRLRCPGDKRQNYYDDDVNLRRAQPAPEQLAKNQNEIETGQREQHFYRTHRKKVDRSPEVPGRSPDKQPYDCRDDDPNYADGQGDLGAVQNAGEDVLTKLVRAKQKDASWRVHAKQMNVGFDDPKDVITISANKKAHIVLSRCVYLVSRELRISLRGSVDERTRETALFIEKLDGREHWRMK